MSAHPASRSSSRVVRGRREGGYLGGDKGLIPLPAGERSPLQPPGDGTQAARPGEPGSKPEARPPDAFLALVGILLHSPSLPSCSPGFVGRQRACRRGGRALATASLPNYHAFYVALWAALPALLLLVLWRGCWPSRRPCGARLRPPGMHLPGIAWRRSSTRRAKSRRQRAAGVDPGSWRRRSTAELRKQRRRDRPNRLARRDPGVWAASDISGLAGANQGRADGGDLLLASSLIAILTTLGIVLSLLFESLRFFRQVPRIPVRDAWSPQMAIRADQAGSSGAFGSIPVFWGTLSSARSSP